MLLRVKSEPRYLWSTTFQSASAQRSVANLTKAVAEVRIILDSRLQTNLSTPQLLLPNMDLFFFLSPNIIVIN